MTLLDTFFTCSKLQCDHPPRRKSLESAADGTAVGTETEVAGVCSLALRGPPQSPGSGQHPSSPGRGAGGSPSHGADAPTRRPHLRGEHRGGGHRADLSVAAKCVSRELTLALGSPARRCHLILPSLGAPRANPESWQSPQRPSSTAVSKHAPATGPWWQLNLLLHKKPKQNIKEKTSSGGVLAVTSPKLEGPPVS